MSNARAVSRVVAVFKLPDGRSVELQKLTLSDWTTLAAAALDEYRASFLRQYEDAYQRAVDGGSPAMMTLRLADLRAAEARAEALTEDSLPRKSVAMAKENPKARGEVVYGPAWECPACSVRWGKDEEARGDSAEFCPNCMEATGIRPAADTTKKLPVVQIRVVDYPIWWLMTTPSGRIHAVWLSMRRANPATTFDDANQLFTSAAEEGGIMESALNKAAQTVGEISRPTLGNPDGSHR